jgi:hypothetical protein
MWKLRSPEPLEYELDRDIPPAGRFRGSFSANQSCEKISVKRADTRLHLNVRRLARPIRLAPAAGRDTQHWP